MLVYPINKKSHLNKGFKTKNKKENVTTYIARKIDNEVNLSDNEWNLSGALFCFESLKKTYSLFHIYMQSNSG